MLILIRVIRQNLKVDDISFLDYLKEEAYHNEIKEFKDILISIGKEQGGELADLKRMISIETLDKLFLIMWPRIIKVPNVSCEVRCRLLSCLEGTPGTEAVPRRR